MGNQGPLPDSKRAVLRCGCERWGSGGGSATVAIAVVVVLSSGVATVQHHSPMLA